MTLPMIDSDPSAVIPRRGGLRELTSKYRTSSDFRGGWQVMSAVLGFAGCWMLSWLASAASLWWCLPLAIPGGLFLVRIFVLHHDCGHSSLFRSARVNEVVGFLLSLFSMTPYHRWRRNHALHHATSGDLDRRGHGDIFTLTVQEYLALPMHGRRLYRIYRHPLVLLGIGSWMFFVFGQRMSFYVPRSWRFERISGYFENLLLAAFVAAGCFLVGTPTFLAVHVPMTMVATAIGTWLLIVQHAYDGTYWRRHPNWSFEAAAMVGSSYLELPAVLQWFTASIGFHHIHHLDSRVPNYRLQQCFSENRLLHSARRLTLCDAVACLRLALWDESRSRMATFEDAHRIVEGDHGGRS